MKPPRRDRRSRPTVWYIAGAIVVIGAGVAAWLFWPDAKRPLSTSTSTSTSLIKEVKPAPAPKAKEPEKPAKQKREDMWARVEKLPNGNEKRWTVDGTCYYVDMERSRVFGRATFTNDVESILAMYIRPGEEMPPPPTTEISDEEAMAACNIKIYAYNDDPNEVLDEREAVDYLKKELKTYLENGGHANDFLADLIRRQENEAEYVNMTREEVKRLIREDDCLLAAQLLEKMNEKLAEKGIPPVKLTDDYREAMEHAVEQEKKNEQK